MKNKNSKTHCAYCANREMGQKPLQNAISFAQYPPKFHCANVARLRATRERHCAHCANVARKITLIK